MDVWGLILSGIGAVLIAAGQEMREWPLRGYAPMRPL